MPFKSLDCLCLPFSLVIITSRPATKRSFAVAKKWLKLHFGDLVEELYVTGSIGENDAKDEAKYAKDLPEFAQSELSKCRVSRKLQVSSCINSFQHFLSHESC